MPYLTPDEIPEVGACRPLFIPASSDWLAIVSGALTELVKSWNWEQQGSVTVPEALAVMENMIALYYAGTCADDCELPEGGSVIRIGEDGHLEQLIDGEWQTPTGDYVIPPPEAREGGTESDQICLAAANAVNVLEQLYESLSDSWNEALDTAEALTAFILAANTALGFLIAPITAGITAFLGVVFTWAYVALEYLIADLWDEDFSEQLKCFLVQCATNDAGVVTFDWDCLMGKLNSLADNFDLTESQLRLYLQVTYLLYFIGGVDGLNLAGGTTEITEATCNCDCPEITDWVFIDSNTGIPTVADVTWNGGDSYTVYASLNDGGGGNYFWLSRSTITDQFFVGTTTESAAGATKHYWTYDGTYHSHAGDPDGFNIVRFYMAWDDGIGIQHCDFTACPL